MLNFIRRGTGAPLLLIHGLGGTWQSWNIVLPALAQAREIIAIDLPGHGSSPTCFDSGTFQGLVDSVEKFIDGQNLDGIDTVGSSLGARIALELARRGKVGATVSLDPGGFWQGWERRYFRQTLEASIKLIRWLEPGLPYLTRSAVTRSMLLAQLSARPWALPAQTIALELKNLAATELFDALVQDLSSGPAQKGLTGPRSQPITIGWGRQDRLCLPRQAARAQEAFPTASFHWFDKCGHFPMWDQPGETVRLILEGCAPRPTLASISSI